LAVYAAPADLLQITLLGEALERGPVAVFVFDESGRYVAVNEYACELLGYSREELLARPAALPVDRSDGWITVQRRDGAELTLRFRARETKVAEMAFSVGVAWPETG
jgi:PAS domain-containing protein